MQYKVLRDLVQIEILPDDDAFNVSDVSYAKVINKGPDCKGNYEIGDIVGFIKNTEYRGRDICFIMDENVLMVRL